MKKKILIVDDDPDFVEAIATLLGSKGYDTESANNGKEGFDKAKTYNPDLILLDVMMPKADGFDIARALKEEETTKNAPVIIITGVRRQMGVAFKFEPDETWLPVKAVMEKPVKPEELLKKVAEALG